MAILRKYGIPIPKTRKLIQQKADKTMATIVMAQPPTCQSYDFRSINTPNSNSCTITTIINDLISDYDRFASFFGTYFDNTLPAIYDLQKMIVALRTAFMAQMNFHNNMKYLILTSMSNTLKDYVSAYSNITTIPTSFTKRDDVSLINSDYDTYNGALSSYVGSATSGLVKDVGGALTAYSNLYTSYNTFRRNALRITETGAPAPSTFLRNEPIIDTDIADLSGFVPLGATDTLDGKTGAELWNALFSLGQKYGKDGRKTSTVTEINKDLLLNSGVMVNQIFYKT
jgi:hypothetical protein